MLVTAVLVLIISRDMSVYSYQAGFCGSSLKDMDCEPLPLMD